MCLWNEQAHVYDDRPRPEARGPMPLTAGAGIALAALALLGVAAYLCWALPRLSARAAGVLSAALLVAGVCTSILWAPWLAVPTAALGFGHFGWWLRSVRAPMNNLPTKASAAPSSAPAKAPAPALASTRGAEAGAPVVRQSLGRYRIERELGRGAMGAVFLGLDPQIGRQVAIKTMALSREYAGADLVEARARFFREAEMAGRLQHRDIVTIFDAGEEDGLAYIAMEFVKGRDLLPNTVVPRLLALPEVLRTAARVADALAYAHTQGVVHRDIKPANVMLDVASDTVKVTDFGIARVTDANRTRTGRVLGTPSFMSPEQMSGGQVDGRSDLYSLGVMLFQLVTGALPHASDSMAELMYRIANEAVPDVRSLRPELPAALAGLIASALEKRPERRPADGARMAAELRAMLDGLGSDPIEPPSSAPDNAPRPGTFETTVELSHAEPRHNSET